jgi:phosphomannomutase
MSMTTKEKIEFGTDGWQGIIADDFTFENVWQVTRAIALYLETAYTQDRPVLIGYDTRFLADRFAYSAAEILADFGRTVKIVDRDCPIPVITYQARLLDSAGALIFTASHNSAKYCGIKYIPDDAAPATTEITDKIVANLDKANNSPPSGKNNARIEYFDPKPAYLKFIYSLLDIDTLRSAALKIKYDALYSTSRGYLDAILDYCSVDLESFNNKRDVLFGGGMSEPQPEYLQQLIKSVKKDKADLGFATDGDGDRLGIVDDRGQFMPPNLILLVVARHLYKNKGKRGAIVRSVATTHLLDNLARKYNLDIYETSVGFKYIGQKMCETEVLIGGEESGELSIGGHIPDGILANMLVAEAVAMEGKPLSLLVEEAIAEAGGELFNTRLDLPLDEAQQAAILAYYRDDSLSDIIGNKIVKVDRRDGVKLHLEDGSWLLLRPSKTEPVMRVYLETNFPTKQMELTEYIKQIVAKFDRDKGL